jgi:exodeoxyribonuclease VII small subunit
MSDTSDTEEALSVEEIRYADAIDELETILEQIEDEDVDLDDLAVKVERASELVDVCREKIDDTETRVRDIIEDLDTEESEA